MHDQGGEINALLGQGTEFNGKLTFQGTVRIDGAFTGEIRSDGVLVIGEGAEIKAEIDVATLIICGGEVYGNVKVREMVEIYNPGRLHGNIVSPQVFIEKGVIFEGECHMEPVDGAE